MLPAREWAHAGLRRLTFNGACGVRQSSGDLIRLPLEGPSNRCVENLPQSSDAEQPLSVQSHCDFLLGRADQVKLTAIDAGNRTAIAADRTFVVEIGLAMIRQRVRIHDTGTVGQTFQPPAPQCGWGFQEEVPVQVRVIVFQDRKGEALSGHVGCHEAVSIGREPKGSLISNRDSIAVG